MVEDKKAKPPFWSGSVWYTHEKGYVIRHQNEGEIEGEEDPSFCWRPGIDGPND